MPVRKSKGKLSELESGESEANTPPVNCTEGGGGEGDRGQDIALSTHRLGWNMIKHVYDASAPTSTSGVTLSPLSITIALGMLAGAAATESQKKLLCGRLGVDDPAMLASSLRSLLGTLSSGGGMEEEAKELPVSVANALFTDSTFETDPLYKVFLETFAAEQVEFPELPKARAEINTWIARHTQDLIPTMLCDADLAHAVAVLVNALAFRGTWDAEFNRDYTEQNHPFRVGSGNVISTAIRNGRVDMMFHHDKTILTATCDTFTAVLMPYVSPNPSAATAMVAYLPNKKETPLADILPAIRAQWPLPDFENVNYSRFGFPRFHLETTQHPMELLEDLGYPVRNANYSGMGKGQSLIPHIIHQAVVKVDEKGTVAAAATAIVMRSSLRLPPKPSLVFDRPFAFALLARSTRVVLFTGVFTGGGCDDKYAES